MYVFLYIFIFKDTLRFFKNPACTELIASYSGRGPSAFPPVVIPASQFWITFSSESNTAEWGYVSIQ